MVDRVLHTWRQEKVSRRTMFCHIFTLLVVSRHCLKPSPSQSNIIYWPAIHGGLGPLLLVTSEIKKACGPTSRIKLWAGSPQIWPAWKALKEIRFTFTCIVLLVLRRPGHLYGVPRSQYLQGSSTWVRLPAEFSEPRLTSSVLLYLQVDSDRTSIS